MTSQSPSDPVRFYRLGQAMPAPKAPHVALVPGQAAPLVALKLPDGIKGRARDRIARLQLSDMLGQNGSDLVMRPFLSSGVKQNWHRLCLTDRAALEDWRAAVADAGPQCQALLPDYLSLPAAAKIWSLSVEDGMLLARLGLQDGFSAEPALAEVLLARALVETPPKAVYAITPIPEAVSALIETKNIPVLRDPTDVAALDLGPLQVLAQGEMSLDLARDPEDTEAQIRRQLRPWIAPALLFVLAALLWAIGTGLQTRQLAATTAKINADTAAAVQRQFLGNEPVLDVRAQVARVVAARLATTTDGSESDSKRTALPMLRQATGLLERSEATVHSLLYQNGTGLSVELDLESFAALDSLILDFRAAPLRVLIEEASAKEGSGITALLLIRDVTQEGQR